jgi:hypothetical protein
MPVTAITTSIAHPNASGTLGSFVGSGNTSSVFSHEQSAFITYAVVDESTINTSWPTTCTTKKVFKVSFTAGVDEDIFDWSYTSGTDLDTYVCQQPTVHSYDSSTGLGTSGYISVPVGSYSRLATSADYRYHHVSHYDDILMASPIGQSNERADDPTSLNSWVLIMNTMIRQGGLLYSDTNSSNDATLTNPEYGWETHLLC